MKNNQDSVAAPQSANGTPPSGDIDQQRDQWSKAADEHRQKMEDQARTIRDLILPQPPIQLLGYVWAQFHMGILADLREKQEEYRPDKKLVENFQLILEYLHAVWSCHANLADERTPLDEAKAGALFDTFDELKTSNFLYCMSSSAANRSSATEGKTEFQAKFSWALIRGNRYQVLEEEFFAFVLAPHADALQKIYGMEPNAIAAEIQAMANSIRAGVGESIEMIATRMEETHALMAEKKQDMAAAIASLSQTDATFTREVESAFRDLLFGGICNISRHTRLTAPLLEDISYLPGENTVFFAEGEFAGTPMRTLPARVRPGIKLGGDYYIADGTFARDASYRAIQRGLLKRAPEYREEWNRRQKTLIEQAYPAIFTDQLAGATVYSEVYFQDAKTGQWVESDLLIILDDVLFIVEAKAGVMIMHSPATNFDRHERTIRELIIKAYEQCKRFVEYLASDAEVPVYNRRDGEWKEIARLRRGKFRKIFPIGLTVEAFTPFSAMSKELSEIRPILGKYPFVSMSVDDLFVLNRFLPTTGELLHYLDVRQAVAGIPNAMLFDEVEHLGAYISDNRCDISIRNQLKKADMVAWDSFGDVVDKYFEGDTWKTEAAPRQKYPEPLAQTLEALDRRRPVGWLEIDTLLRNFGTEGRNDVAGMIAGLRQTLAAYPARRFQVGEDEPLQFWLCRKGVPLSSDEMRHHAEIGCLAAGSQQIKVLRLFYDEARKITGARCSTFQAPSILQENYAALGRQAEGQRTRRIEFESQRSKKSKSK
jgi:hypothetical protein